jgi:hypothetical protein
MLERHALLREAVIAAIWEGVYRSNEIGMKNRRIHAAHVDVRGHERVRAFYYRLLKQTTFCRRRRVEHRPQMANQRRVPDTRLRKDGFG